jgi:hypothetical protein
MERIVGILYAQHASSWSGHAAMAGGDPTRFSWSVKYRTYSRKCCVFATQSEHSLAVCVHGTVLPLLFFSNSGEILIVHSFSLTFRVNIRRYRKQCHNLSPCHNRLTLKPCLLVEHRSSSLVRPPMNKLQHSETHEAVNWQRENWCRN